MKILDTEAQGSFLTGENAVVGEGDVPRLHGEEHGSSMARIVPDLALCVSLIRNLQS